MRDFVVTEMTYRDVPLTAAFCAEDSKITSLRVQRQGETSPVGKIYRGTVENVARQIGGAFVRLSGDERVFLPFRKRDLKNPNLIRASVPIVIQISKEAAGIKQAVASTRLSLSGKYCVVFSEPGRPGFSSKLEEDRKELLRKWIPEDCGKQFSVLIRTAASKVEKAELLEEIAALQNEMSGILKRGESASQGDLLYSPRPFYVEALEDLREDPDRIFSDISLYAEQLEKTSGMPAAFEKDGRTLSLPELYQLTRELDHLTSKKVWLKSGAFLVIEPTEAFVSVDVNTGKHERGRIPEEVYRKVNLEAAEELARQIRLRNLSGMILVDFISMESEDHNQELINVMKKHLRKDSVSAQVIDLTPLGIMEIVRQKVRKPLAEEIGL